MTDGDVDQMRQAPAPGPSIVARTARGAGWIIGWRFATRGIGVCSTLILVRLLTPDAFGLVTLASGLIDGLDAVAGFGVEGAIIRTDQPGREIYDAGFTINVARACATAFVLLLAAVPLARFFGNPHLTGVICVLALAWAVSGFANIGMVEYRRDLAFDMEFKSKIIPRLISLCVTIPSAIIWHSYWALVGGMVTTQLVTVIVSYRLHPFRPRFGVRGMRHIFGFSFWEWLIGLLNLAGTRGDTVIVGRLLGTAAVGIYGVGSEIASLPGGEIVSPLCRALFSGFVAERREGVDGSRTMLRVLGMLAILTFPMNVGLSLVAYPITKICFGAAWLGAVPLIQLLGVSSTINLFGSVGEALFSAHAWLKTIFWLVMVTTVVRLALALVLIPHFGLLGGAIAAAIVSVVQEAIYMGTALRRLRLSLLGVLRSVARPALAVTVMAASLAALGLGWNSQDPGNVALGERLAEAVVLGAAIYVGTLGALWAAAGRPAGAEAEMLASLRQLRRRVQARVA